MIPKIIHVIWIGGDEPEWARQNIAAFQRLNPDHEVCVHRDARLVPKAMMPQFEACTRECMRSDILRWYALRDAGGWYCDADVHPVRPVSDIERQYGLDGDKLFVIQGASALPLLDPAIMACGPGCHAVDEAIKYVERPASEWDGHICRYGMYPLDMVRITHPEWLAVGKSDDFYPSVLAYTRARLAEDARNGMAVSARQLLMHEGQGSIRGRRTVTRTPRNERKR